jgi:predicted nucleotidyltransferase
MDDTRISAFLDQVAGWSQKQAEIHAVILVGSQARGNAKADSDVDLVIICGNPEYYLRELDWIREFGTPERHAIEGWGMVTSLRVWFESGLEVEFGLTSNEWIREPLDVGTKRVISDGYRILVDKSNTLTRLFA